MAFRFSLAAVLKYREELEKREEQILEMARETLARLENQLAEVREQQCGLVVERESLLKRGAFGDDLHHTARKQQEWKRLEDELGKQLSVARLAYEKQMKLFLAVRQKREVLDELKKNQHESYREKQDRLEQQRIDEIFGSRLNRET